MSAALLAAGLAALPATAAGRGGAWLRSAHGRPDTGVARVPGLARGECGHCHGAPRDHLGRRSDDAAGHARLFAGNDNALCLCCHAAPRGRWAGGRVYEGSAHATAMGAVWPGPEPRARSAADGGKCVNCHDPHGVADRAGLLPSLLRVRGAALCLACHDGSPAGDVAAAFARPHRHPLAGGAGASPSAPGAVAGPDASCSACHDPHAAAEAGALGSAARGTGALLGAARVRIPARAPGASTRPVPVGAADPSPAEEHQVCYRCHAGGDDPASARRDVAAALNPANASFHPVEARGRGGPIDRRAFVDGWGPGRRVACSDCHGPDDDGTRGPHGSAFPRILRRRYAATVEDATTHETDLCFACHAYRTYADPLGGADAGFSRYGGHVSHVAKGYSCAACHAPHGSPQHPALVALRPRALAAFASDAGGGSCTALCHVRTLPTATYRVRYPR